MSFALEQVPAIALIALLGALLQGALGFGIALFALPLMVWVDVPLPVAIAVVHTTSVGQMGWGCWKYREHILWKPAAGVNLGRLATLPLGVLTLAYLVSLGTGPVKLVVGVALLLAVVIRTAVRVQPREKVRWWWAALAGTTSGYLGGVVGMSGPPIVLWVTAHNWSTDKTRAMMWSSMLPVTPVIVALMMYKFGMPVVYGTLLGLALLPLTVMGAMVGTDLGAKLSAHRLRGAALVVLTIIALASVIEPILAMRGA